MYKITFKDSAKKEIKKISSSSLKEVVKKIDSLSTNPRPSGCKKLRGDDLWRVRQGDYRIIYAVHDKIKIINIRRIRHRKDVYKK